MANLFLLCALCLLPGALSAAVIPDDNTSVSGTVDSGTATGTSPVSSGTLTPGSGQPIASGSAGTINAGNAAAVPSLDTTTMPSTTTTTQPPTTTEVCQYAIDGCPPGTELHLAECLCVCMHEPHEDPTKFVMIWGGHKFNMSCAATTVWRQDLCSCHFPLMSAVTAPASAVIQAQVNCINIINYSFNPQSGVYTDGTNHIDFENEVNPIRAVNVTGASVEGKAADFTQNSVSLPYLQGNGLTDDAFIEARVKPTNENVSMVILSNGCTNNAMKSEESLRVAFNPVTKVLNVTVLTHSVNSLAICNNVTSSKGWYKFTLAVDKSFTTVSVNDVQCNTIQGSGIIPSTSCGLAIGSDPLAAYNDFSGYVDYVKVTKHCSTDQQPTPVVA